MAKVLTEASGSLVGGYLIKAIQDAGHIAVASDITTECAGRHLADDFIEMPRSNARDLWARIEQALASHQVDVVVPSLDETLVGWAERAEEFARRGTRVILSPPETTRVFRDKWLTYQFFAANGIPTPATSLQQEYPLVKPRDGRGAAGVRVTEEPVEMAGLISQELLTGTEYTVDIFCDREGAPVYIVPRRRLSVREGKSLGGIVEKNTEIEQHVRSICAATPFRGPINAQCFVSSDGAVRFTEINPRIAGGMALGFAATENWMRLIVDHFVNGKPIEPKPVRHGMKMMRYYAEVFVPAD